VELLFIFRCVTLYAEARGTHTVTKCRLFC